MARKSNTRAAHGAGSIRQRPDGTWEARFVTGRDPGTGKPIRKSLYAKTQKEVRQKLAQAVAAVDNQDYRDPCKMLLGEWLDVWTGTYCGGIKPRTMEIYRTDIRVHIKPALGAVRLEALNAQTIQSFYNELGQPHGDKPGLSPKTVKNIHGVLHKALQQAVLLGYLRFNPTEVCTLPRSEKKELAPLDEEDAAAFLSAIQGTPYETLLTVALFTGMREGEIMGLMWECVDFDAGTITVNKQLQRYREATGGVYRLVETKNSKGRILAPAASVMALLRRHKAQQAACQLRAGSLWENSGLVFTNELGHHLTQSEIYRAFKKAAASIGRPDARFHDLRHSYAVAAIRAGDDIKTVQENLGHATAAFTLDVYGHVTKQMKQASADRMEAFIKSLSPPEKKYKNL